MSQAVTKNARIGVLGAGAAGLSAAHFLRKRGYTNVTVFEKLNRVGGKCETVWIDDRWYDVGASALSIGYSATRAIAREYNVNVTSIARFNRRKHAGYVDVDCGLPIRTSDRQKLAALRAVANFELKSALCRGKSSIFSRALNKDLAMPFGEWARKHKCEAVLPAMAHFNTGWGYGYLEEVPALYVLRYNKLVSTLLPLLLGHWIYSVELGYQHLWEMVAGSMDVRLGVEVNHIERSPSGVRLHHGSGTEQLDALIMTVPPTVDMLACDSEESELFERIRAYDYNVCIMPVQGLTASVGYYGKNFSPHRSGHVVFSYQRWPDRDLTNLYAFAPTSGGANNIEDILGGDLAALGATFDEPRLTRKWPYFYHVSPADITSGWFDRVEARQGRGRTFFAGSLMSFETVEHVVRYSQGLVNRFF
jgi:oxygen-dependent protoporphyrinogen oxidase